MSPGTMGGGWAHFSGVFTNSQWPFQVFGCFFNTLVTIGQVSFKPGLFRYPFLTLGHSEKERNRTKPRKKQNIACQLGVQYFELMVVLLFGCCFALFCSMSCSLLAFWRAPKRHTVRLQITKLLQQEAPQSKTPTTAVVCLFVCLLVCLFVCFFPTKTPPPKKQYLNTVTFSPTQNRNTNPFPRSVAPHRLPEQKQKLKKTQ